MTAGANGAESKAMARWQGQTEANIQALNRRADDNYKKADEATQKAIDAAQRAVDKAEETVTKRLEGFPETYASRVEFEQLRSNLVDLRERMLDRETYFREHAALEERTTKMETGIARAYGGLFIIGLIGVTNLIHIWIG